MKTFLLAPALLCLAVVDYAPLWGRSPVPVAHVIVPGEEVEKAPAGPDRIDPVAEPAAAHPPAVGNPAHDLLADLEFVVEEEDQNLKALPEQLVGRPEPEAVEVAEAEGEPEDGELANLQQNMARLGRKLEVTEKAVEEIVRQRDAARNEAKAAEVEVQRHLRNHQQAMQQLEGFQKELDSARKETAGWKEKAEAGAMTHEDLLKFRAELAGALRQFDLLKQDIAAARSEMQDPIERAALKTSLAKADEERRLLGNEIQVALKARKDVEDDARRTQTDLETKLGVMREKLIEADGVKADLAERTVTLENERANAKALTDRIAALEADHEGLQNELAEAGGVLEEAQNGIHAREAEAARQAEAAMAASREAAAERDKLAAELEGLRKRMEESGRETAELKKTAAEARDQLKAAEEARRVADRNAREGMAALAKAKEEMAFVTKAKEGLEELLFRKTAQLREVRVQLRELQGGEKDNAAREKKKEGEDGKVGLRKAPRAVIVLEG